MKRLILGVLALLLLVGTAVAAPPETPEDLAKIPCLGNDKEISVLMPFVGPMPAVCQDDHGIYYYKPGGPSWAKEIEDYKVAVAKFYADQEKRLKASVLVPWHDLIVGSPAAADFVKRYPYLKKYVDEGTPGTTISIAESRGTVRWENRSLTLNLLFVIKHDPLWCGSGGCAFTTYQDNGHGYLDVEDSLGDEVPIRIFRGSPDAKVSVFMPYYHHHAAIPGDTPDGTIIG